MAIVSSSKRIIQTLIRPTSKERKSINSERDNALTEGGTCTPKVMEAEKLID